jgi:hypothetical protein
MYATVNDAKSNLLGLGDFREFIKSAHQIQILLTLGIGEEWQRARKRVLILPVEEQPTIKWSGGM